MLLPNSSSTKDFFTRRDACCSVSGIQSGTPWTMEDKRGWIYRRVQAN
jgi:hypothetical protein